jgi:hypothetical protein
MRLRDLDFGIANLGNRSYAFGPTLLPQRQGYWQRVNIDPLPPHFLIAMVVQFRIAPARAALRGAMEDEDIGV